LLTFSGQTFNSLLQNIIHQIICKNYIGISMQPTASYAIFMQ